MKRVLEHVGRRVVMERSNDRCELCGRPGTNTHHRMRELRPWNPANLLRVCGQGNASGCHGWIETHPTFAEALGLIVPRGHNPHTVRTFCRPVLFALGWWLSDDDGVWHFADPPRMTPTISAGMAALRSHLDAMTARPTTQEGHG